MYTAFVALLQLMPQWPIINEAVRLVDKPVTGAKGIRACIVAATEPTAGLQHEPDAVTDKSYSNSSNSSGSSSSSSSSNCAGSSGSSGGNGSSSTSQLTAASSQDTYTHLTLKLPPMNEKVCLCLTSIYCIVTTSFQVTVLLSFNTAATLRYCCVLNSTLLCIRACRQLNVSGIT
jgi:hypothetical protein